MIRVSELEKRFIIDGIQQDFRVDGRSNSDFRSFTVETSVIVQSNGSARVKLSKTDVIVGVHVEIGTPDVEFPHQGKSSIRVECAPSASRDFEGKGADEVNAMLISTVSKVLDNSFSIDWKSLCIEPHKKCWVLYVDCLVLDSDGNLFDAIAIAMKSALYDTRIPKVEILRMDDGTTEIELNDDPSDYNRLKVSQMPITITVGKCKNQYIVDPSLEEELCLDSRLTVAVNEQGKICSIQKGGYKCGLKIQEISKMVEISKNIGIELNKQLMETLENQEKLDIPSQNVLSSVFLD